VSASPIGEPPRYAVRMRWVLALVAVAGCYSPVPAPGAPCGPGDSCPSGLVCVEGLCLTPGTVRDSTGPDPDAPLDTTIPGDGPPPDTLSALGCADDSREAFADVGEFPTIAGCGAIWTEAKDLRASKTGNACGGNDTCAAPADACADGWSICGLAGDPVQVTSRVTQQQCDEAADGTFLAAMSHCSFAFPCEYDLPLPCLLESTCSEPVCCGATCGNFPGCPDGVFAATTRAGTMDQGCGRYAPDNATGVLCCKD
jgi:hypothetical protein